MTSKQLNRIYEKAKAEYLEEIQNDDGSYTCKGCDNDFMTISIHHILKRWFKYFFADKRNFVALCFDCHHKAEGTMREQKKLNYFHEMEKIAGKLLKEYYRLKPYEQLLSWKYK